MSLKPVAERLRMLLDTDWRAVKTSGSLRTASAREAEEMAGKLEKGQALLLENVRFHAEEEANDETFSKQLAMLADFYVNDAFGTAHRAHASTVGITKFVEKVRGRAADGERTGLSGQGADPSRTAVRRHPWRGESQRQDRRHPEPDDQGRLR